MTGTATCQVLVAEDEPSIRDLLMTTLRRYKLKSAATVNGGEALRQLERRKWQVLILDLMMPGVTGWEVIEWLAANRYRKPKTVIVVSATDRELLRGLDPTVVNAVIFKPFDVIQLAAYVKASCELPHRDRRRSRIVAASGH